RVLPAYSPLVLAPEPDLVQHSGRLVQAERVDPRLGPPQDLLERILAAMRLPERAARGGDPVLLVVELPLRGVGDQSEPVAVPHEAAVGVVGPEEQAILG